MSLVIDAIRWSELIVRTFNGVNNVCQSVVTRERRDERATGIEPAWPAWKAGTLPLSYARVWSGKVPLARVTAKRFLPWARTLDRLLFPRRRSS